MLADPVPESLGARQPMKESTTTADGVGGRERLATMAADAMERPGATAGAGDSLDVGARAVNIALESRAERPVVQEE